MIDDLKKYSTELADTGGIVHKNLRDFLGPVREMMANLKGPMFSDNAILHGIWMLLASHLTYVICQSKGNFDKKYIEEISHKTQWEIGKALNSLLKENAGEGTMVTFMEAPKKEGN